jgi:hypothetical protein
MILLVIIVASVKVNIVTQIPQINLTLLYYKEFVLKYLLVQIVRKIMIAKLTTVVIIIY